VKLVLGAGAVAALVLLTAWFFEMPLEKAALAAPIIVLSFGAAVGLVVLWTKVISDSFRGGGGSRRSRARDPEPGSRTPDVG
jgi:hypothetical protein